MPVVLTQREARELLKHLSGTRWLVVALLYGTGMRLLEGLWPRVKDIEFERREIVVREDKGNKDRLTVLPENLIQPLKDQLSKARRLHTQDLDAGFGEVYLPEALACQYPKAGKAWGWQYVFPSQVRSIDPRSGSKRRHHISPESVQCVKPLAARRSQSR
jgi:integrase